MKKIIISILILSLLNCSDKKKKEIPKNSTIEVISKIDSTKALDSLTIIDSVVIDKSIEKITIKKKKKRKPGLYFLTDLIGKYPTQEKIFNDKYLAKRLKKIKRFNYDNFVRDWNTETPIYINNNIIHASGCRAHNCPDSGYELFIDLKNDNINIYFFMGNTLRVYKEKGWITLPKIYQEELDIKMENAKIGSTSDDLTSKYHIDINRKNK